MLRVILDRNKILQPQGVCALWFGGSKLGPEFRITTFYWCSEIINFTRSYLINAFLEKGRHLCPSRGAELGPWIWAEAAQSSQEHPLPHGPGTPNPSSLWGELQFHHEFCVPPILVSVPGCQRCCWLQGEAWQPGVCSVCRKGCPEGDQSLKLRGL